MDRSTVYHQRDAAETVVCNDYNETVPDGMKWISVSPDMAWILVRIVCNGTDDISNVESIQEQFVLVPLIYYLSNQTYIPPNGTYDKKYNFTPVNRVNTMTPSEFFSTANILMVTNPPAPADAPMVKEM